MHARWEQFDLEAGIWTKPSHMTKQKKKEYLPLSSEALAILRGLKQQNQGSPDLFPGKVPGKPIQEIKTFWRFALKRAGLENVRIHDLRHTFASIAASYGLSLSHHWRSLRPLKTPKQQPAMPLGQPLKDAAEKVGDQIMKCGKA